MVFHARLLAFDFLGWQGVIAYFLMGVGSYKINFLKFVTVLYFESGISTVNL